MERVIRVKLVDSIRDLLMGRRPEDCDSELELACVDGTQIFSEMLMALFYPDLCSLISSVPTNTEKKIIILSEVSIRDIKQLLTNICDSLSRTQEDIIAINGRESDKDSTGLTKHETDAEVNVDREIEVISEEINPENSDLRFQCSTCHLILSSRYQLQKHSITHSNERPYKCMHCSKSYKRKADRDAHIHRIHSEESDLYVCKCGAEFDKKFNLIRHQTVHSSKRHNCPKCNQCFSRKDNLIRHLKSC